jgi:protein-tyrosine-phosphatase
MTVRAVSRGVAPDATVPVWVVEALGKDGFTVAGFVPRRLGREDVGHATRVVTIGAESPLFAAAPALERWDDIPPASTSYAASRDRMRERIQALLATLAARPSPAP